MPISKLTAPRITPPSLSGLSRGTPAHAASGEDVDGLLIEGADLSDVRLDSVTFIECELVDAVMESTRLNGCRFLDVRFDRLDARGLTASGSKWRDSEILASRLGAIGLYDTEIDSLRVVGSKVAYLNLRGSEVHDLVLEDCVIEELDLTDAALTRATFAGCRIGTLTLREATLSHVDLRGASLDVVEPVQGLRGTVIDNDQLLELAPLLAAGIGVEVR